MILTHINDIDIELKEFKGFHQIQNLERTKDMILGVTLLVHAPEFLFDGQAYNQHKTSGKQLRWHRGNCWIRLMDNIWGAYDDKADRLFIAIKEKGSPAQVDYACTLVTKWLKTDPQTADPVISSGSAGSYGIPTRGSFTVMDFKDYQQSNDRILSKAWSMLEERLP